MLRARSITLPVLVLVLVLGQALLPNIAHAATVVTFPDPKLEAVIRVSIDKPSGEIYLEDVQRITELDAFEKGISNIEGIEHLVNLETLYLSRNNISDIAPLKRLTKLKVLTLCSNNLVDVSALSDLHELTYLSLFDNKVQDISALQGLTKLDGLMLKDNPIADYAPVYGIYGQLTRKDFTLPSIVGTPGPAATGNTADGIRVILDGKTLSFDTAPFIENDRVMVPMRAIFEALGAEVQWNGDTRTITATKGPTTVLLTIGETTATVNGKPVTLDVAPKIVSDRTLVPLRFVAEALGCEVSWDAAARLVGISSTPAAAQYLRVVKDEGSRIAYYINGELGASVFVGPNGVRDTLYEGDGWTLRVSHDYFVYRNSIGMQLSTYLIQPNYLNYASQTVYLPAETWKTDPRLSRDQKEAIACVLEEIEARNQRLRPLKTY